MPFPVTVKLTQLWRNFPLMIKGLAVIGLPVAVLVVGFNLFLTEKRWTEVERHWVTHTALVRENLQALSGSIVSMESAARGYVISPQEDFRKRFVLAKAEALQKVNQVAGLVSDNPIQQARMPLLRTVVSEKISRMEQLLAGRRGATVAEVEVQLRRSAEAMKPVETTIAQIDATEARLERVRVNELERSGRDSERVVGLTVSAGLLALIGSFLFITFNIGRRMKSLQISARALRTGMPLARRPEVKDEIGQLQTELERSSEIIATRTSHLRASEKQLRTILDSTKALVYVKDLESRFVLVNCEYERVVGIKAEQAIGRGPVELFGPEMGGRLRANDLIVLETKQPAQFEESLRRNGRELTYISVKVPLLDAKGKPYGICGISTDISATKRRAADDQSAGRAPASGKRVFSTADLPEVSAYEVSTAENSSGSARPDASALGQVAGSVAHDFNNILTTIIGYSNLLLADIEEKDRATSPAGAILRASQRAAALTKQLFAFDRTIPTNLRVLETEDVLTGLEAIVAPMVDEETIQLRIKVDPKSGRVKADRAQLEQLILNLAANARDAMPTGGTITINASPVTLPEVKGRSKAGDFVAISVCDEGLGIPPHVQSRMFEPFFTTKRAGRGTGLGLAISAMIAQQCGGWLSCKSEMGLGSAFTLYLPRVTEPVTIDDSNSPRQKLRHGHETVLVVEDEPAVGEMEALVLRNLGYKVLVAESSEEAESSLARAGSVDLVLTDLNLPGINGRALIERIRQDHPSTKFILTSGSETSDPSGLSDLTCLSKPFEITTLAETVRSVLDS